jgi:hypothetical protein
MKKLKLLAIVVGSALALSFGGTALAQPQGMDFQNMDPQQMMNMIQERINSSFRDQMNVTNDTEWAAIEQKIAAVTKARMATMADTGMMGMMPGGRGGAGGFASMFGTPSPETEALRRAVEDNAPPAQIHALLIKFQAARKQKEAAVTKAEAELKAILTPRQEAIAVVGGLVE